jgi:hypothetical protein
MPASGQQVGIYFGPKPPKGLETNWIPTQGKRMRLRGLTGARDEFHLAAIVQNLKTLAIHHWHSSRKGSQ